MDEVIPYEYDDSDRVRTVGDYIADLNVDVCIIGGGITGLSTGYYLSKETDVVILEKDRICNSTSGANTGKLTSQHGLFYDYLINSFLFISFSRASSLVILPLLASVIS